MDLKTIEGMIEQVKIEAAFVSSMGGQSLMDAFMHIILNANVDDTPITLFVDCILPIKHGDYIRVTIDENYKVHKLEQLDSRVLGPHPELYKNHIYLIYERRVY
jgi:hypothetical protein